MDLGSDETEQNRKSGLGPAAMAGSGVPAAALGVTNPAEWDANNRLSEIVWHLVYRLTTSLAYDFLADV